MRGGSLLQPDTLKREALKFAIFCVAFYFAYRFGMAFSQTSASPFWFPDAVLLCALLVTTPRRWALYVLAALPIRLFSEVAQDTPFWFLFTTFLIDSAKGMLTAVALRRFVGLPLRLDSIPQFGKYVGIAVVAVPALGAFAGAAARAQLGDSYWRAWDQWFMGDALAQLVLTPAILYWIFGSDLRTLLLNTRKTTEACAVTIGLLTSTYVAANTGAIDFLMQQARFFLPIPFLFWAALRFGMFGAAGAITLFSAMVIQAALNQQGPFAGLPPDDTATAMQHFLLLRAAPLYLVAVVVEQRWHMEKTLRESEQRFRDIANAAPVMIWVGDRHKGNSFCNDGWLTFTGRTSEQESGDGWAEGIHPEDKQRVLEAFGSAFATERRFDMEYRHRRHDGVYRWVHTSGVPHYTPDGEFLGYVGAVADTTERKRAEEATHALAHAQRLAVMGELTAMVAHEIRQPLSAILLSADAAQHLLRRPQPPIDELIEIMAAIRSYDLRADDTIRAIRAFARNQPSRRVALDLNATIIDVLRLVSSDADRRRIPLWNELSSTLPRVMGDSTQIQQVLVNLIVNAMDAQADVAEARRHVTVSSRHCDGHVEVCVRDGGCGIPPEKMPLLFESFFTTNQRGMGLGLSIVRTIISDHQGRVWAENNPAGGATFRFTLPLAEAESAVEEHAGQ